MIMLWFPTGGTGGGSRILGVRGRSSPQCQWHSKNIAFVHWSKTFAVQQTTFREDQKTCQPRHSMVVPKSRMSRTLVTCRHEVNLSTDKTYLRTEKATSFRRLCAYDLTSSSFSLYCTLAFLFCGFSSATRTRRESISCNGGVEELWWYNDMIKTVFITWTWSIHSSLPYFQS